MVRAITLVFALTGLFALACAQSSTESSTAAASTTESPNIKCHECTNCDEDVEKQPLVECKPGVEECFTLQFNKNDVRKGCLTASFICLPELSCEKCEGSECNSATSLSASLLVGIVAAAILKNLY